MNTSTMTTAEFLDALAAGTPTPGGGGAAALAASQAAALLSMVANFTMGKKKYADVEVEMQNYRSRTETLRRDLLVMVDRDAEAFTGVVATYSMPKETETEKAARADAMQQALKQAVRVPFAVGEHCLEIIRLAETIGAKGNPNVVSDAATALYLALGAFKSAMANVSINLKFIKDPDFAADWVLRRDTLLAETDAAYARAKAAIEQSLGVAL